MERLLYFIYQYRAFFIFLALEVFCAWLIVENNHYQGAKFFNSSNTVVATLNNFSQSIRDYFLLRDVNNTLAQENALLRKQVEKYNQRLILSNDTSITDSVLTNRFDFISAKVVNNQVDRFKNFITINRGSADGIAPGMAVISAGGIVGKVKIASEHYGVVTSILNIDVMTSAMLKRTGHFGTIQWDGKDPDIVSLEYIPKHVKPLVGDTIMTSGYSSIYPAGVNIGTITDVKLKDEGLLYAIKVKLSQDFRKLSYVSVVKNYLIDEQDSLEQVIQEMQQ